MIDTTQYVGIGSVVLRNWFGIYVILQEGKLIELHYIKNPAT